MCSIASGSSGNCIYVGSDTTHLLVDAGISGKRTKEGLEKLGVKPEELDGIFITHEHADHINGLGVMARKYHIPVYGTKGTLEAIRCSSMAGKIEECLFYELKADQKVTVKDLTVNPMKISHDAAEPVAYRISHGKQRLGIITDLGCYNDYTVECLRGMNALLIEANHDANMLQVGPYPYYLKRRIAGDRGHLSNELSGQLLCRLLNDGLQTIVLGHLSKENNLPELAYETVRVEIAMADNKYKAGDFPIQVADRNEMSEIITIGEH